MTESNLNESAAERVRLIQSEHALHKQGRDAFEREWERAANGAGVNPSLVSYDGSPAHLAAEISDFISVRNSYLGGLEYWSYSDSTGYEEISEAEAAKRSGVDMTELQDATLPLQLALHAARPYWEDARSVRRASDALAVQSPMAESTPAAGSAEAASDDETAEWTVTPQRALGAWIETTASLRTLIETKQYTALRNAIREMDSHLEDYTSGGMPPGSYEEEYLYLDALNRATVPVASSAPATVLDDLRARGERVPDFPQPTEVKEATGVSGLHVSELQRALTEPGKSPTPRTHEAVNFARAWRAVTKNLDEGLIVSYDVQHAPGQALVERLDGNLDSYVTAMRTGPGEVTLSDATGNEIEQSAVEERLGLGAVGASAVMAGLRDGLDAATGADRSENAVPERWRGIPVADSLEDSIEQARRQGAVRRGAPLPLPPSPISGATSTPGLS